ncbi:hypothetical protein MC7420_1686 [Coleofasciculus chthonoplastes PCC 7420]|uniref:Uncharacterized protein n=1 Tax=Coleofasciculus chthonoplastes PCC 7420 TaxID=118168 RepID=B4VMG6_9CYAN|nr:hypothetical protein MC7420_1686 [Coleofasciculus chthonoplastes PCC 7420]
MPGTLDLTNALCTANIFDFVQQAKIVQSPDFLFVQYFAVVATEK